MTLSKPWTIGRIRGRNIGCVVELVIAVVRIVSVVMDSRDHPVGIVIVEVVARAIGQTNLSQHWDLISIVRAQHCQSGKVGTHGQRAAPTERGPLVRLLLTGPVLCD